MSTLLQTVAASHVHSSLSERELSARSSRLWSVSLAMSLAIVSGTLVTLSIAEYDIWAFAWVGLSPLMLATERCSRARQAFMLGWLSGLVTNLGGLYWLVDLLGRFGSLSSLSAGLIYVVFCAYQGLVFALFAGVLKQLRCRLRVRGKALPFVLLAPLTMVAAELVLPFVFPWNLAMTQAFLPPVIQIAEFTGPTGVTALLMLVNGALCDALLTPARRWLSPAVASCFVLSALGFGAWRIAQLEAAEARAPKLAVGVVQGNIGFAANGVDQQALAARQLSMLQDTSKSLSKAGAELILWTETAYPYSLPRSFSADFSDNASQRVRRGFSANLIFGAASYDPKGAPGTFNNSAFMLDEQGRIGGRYDKNELVAFGERVPFDDQLTFLRKLRLESAGHFVGGKEVSAFTLHKGGESFRLAPMICLEDILPAFGRRVGALHPHLLVNLTNDAWFGPTSEPAQHLALAVFRSVEQRVAMVRAVNTGPSAFISATGRVYGKSERAGELYALRAPEGVRGEVALLEGGHTVFARFGNVFAQLCMALVLGGLALSSRRAGISYR